VKIKVKEIKIISYRILYKINNTSKYYIILL